MIKRLIILLDEQSVPFCHYENKNFYSGKSRLMPLKILEKTIDFAAEQNSPIQFLFGKKKLPAKYENLVKSIPHIKIVPEKVFSNYNGDVVVIDSDKTKKGLHKQQYKIINFRLRKKALSDFAETFKKFIGSFEKFNLCILDIESYSDDDFKIYREQLSEIADTIAEEYNFGNFFECNFITDRLVLTKMNNCNAGIEHLTVAPNGKLYICPGFYYDNPNNSVGNLNDGPEIKNSELFELENAPICSVCDAYHCKRCFYLNKKLTCEINTPSREQCLSAHLEREASAKLLKKVDDKSKFRGGARIDKLGYYDPFDIVGGDAQKSKNIFGEEPEEISENEKDLLLKILEKQDKILSLLTKK